MRDQLRTTLNYYTATIRKNIQELRNNNFNEMLEKVPHDDQNRALWRLTKFIKNRGNEISHLKDGNKTLITPEEKANALE